MGEGPEKHVSASGLGDPLATQPMAQAWDSVQLFCVPVGPDLQL
jgi:hypothetical protein